MVFCCHNFCRFFFCVTVAVDVVVIIVIDIYVSFYISADFYAAVTISVAVDYCHCRNSFVEILSTFITGNIVASVSGNTVNILTCSPGLILCLFLTRESKNLNKAQATSSRSR